MAEVNLNTTIKLVDVLPAKSRVGFRTSQYLADQLKKCSEDTGLSMSYLVELCVNKSLGEITKEIFSAYKKASDETKNASAIPTSKKSKTAGRG